MAAGRVADALVLEAGAHDANAPEARIVRGNILIPRPAGQRASATQASRHASALSKVGNGSRYWWNVIEELR